MNRRLLVTVLLAAACRGAASQAPTFDGRQAHAWVEHMVAAGPRIPNTPAHRAVGDWLLEQLRARRHRRGAGMGARHRAG